MRDQETGPEGLADYKHWKPEFQARALAMLQQAENAAWKPFFCQDPTCNGHPHCTPVESRDCPSINGHIWIQVPDGWACAVCEVGGTSVDDWLWEHARADQRPPRWSDPWQTWVLSGGRGSGKTRTGSETTHKATKVTPRIALIAATGPDFREIMVEGRSGLLATAKPGERPTWEPSRKRLVWPNGCVGQGFSAEEPDRLRGPEHGYVWSDEPAHYPLIDEVWSNMEFGLRVGKNPKVIVTSTPKPTKWMKTLIAHPTSVVHRVSTYLNAHNLADAYRRNVMEKYEGTRLGRQELHGEVIEDVEGALWNYGIIDWVDDAPHLDRIVVAVDPAGSTDVRADETGIVVIGRKGKDQYVLADYTGRYTPDRWGNKAYDAYEEFAADCIVAEKNYGGLMVESVLKQAAKDRARIKLVNSRRGKALRAEPVVARYEQGRVHHVGKRGDLSLLEEEMTSWVPGTGPSPNRVDALVHGSTELGGGGGQASIASPSSLPNPSNGLPFPRRTA